ncbi:hypothetical protein J2S94_003354 [Arthrobacter bambusae]|nr:hypothetical protein [Arthrobacter bambusae]MDQ0241261.1 hypothetical protein [Arthrobacter bambusae]
MELTVLLAMVPELGAVITLHAPMLLDHHGVGTDLASQMLVTVGDNPERVMTEPKFAGLSVSHPSPRLRGRPPGTVAAGAVIGRQTKPSTTLSWCG